MRSLRSLVTLATFLSLPLAAQQPSGAASAEAPPVPQTFDWARSTPVPATTPWGQPIDVASTELIRSWTTLPEYITPLVDHLPDDPAVVSPTDHFGYPIGKPGVLHRADEIYGYFDALAASSPRVRFERLAETEEGNHLALVQVGSERNLARLEEIRAAMQALSDPRVTSEAEAQRLMRDLPVIYTFYAGLHSPETGPPEMVMEMAYRLAVSDDPLIRMVRDSAVVFIVPVAEVDGRNRVVDWHRRYNRDVFTPEDRVPGPPYWGKYIVHDNNRDGLQMSLALTRELIRLALEWHYPVTHDLHESVPYLYTATGTGPYNPTIDPIAVSEWQWMANFEVTALTALGLPGVWTHGFYDGWYPGYLTWVSGNNLNGNGRFYETFGNSVPNTMVRELGERQTRTEWYRPNPPRAETLWSLRNNTNYMETGALTALSLAAQNRTRLLEQYWTKTKNSLERGRTIAPYAWVVPAEQARRADAAEMLENLRTKGIEVHRARAAGEFGDVAVRTGDYMVRMDQPLRNYARTLMEVQEFPEDAPPPYDDVAWTFPLMYNVEAHPVDDAAVLGLAMEPVSGPLAIPGRITSARGAEWYVVEPTASAQAVRAWLALRDVPVFAAEEEVRVGDRSVPAGAWLIQRSSMERDRIETLAREVGLRVLEAPAAAVSGVKRHAMEVPRIALLHTWANTQDGGSVRYALDRLGVPYTYLGEDRLGTEDLRGRFDVILFPNQGGGASAKDIFQGIDPKWGPLAYTGTPEYPTHGYPDSTEDMTGGMGYEGLTALRDFVNRGGTLVTMGSASTIPVEFGLVRDVEQEETRSIFVPGSIVQGVVQRPTHPLAYGYAEEVPLYHRFGPYLRVPEEMEENVVLRYAPTGSLLLSGVAKSPGEMGGDPALVTVPTGQGHLVLFGFDPMHRFQNHGNFGFVWNALMNWNDLSVGLSAEAEPTTTQEGAR